MDDLLKDFKDRMGITYSSKDEAYKRQLLASQKAVARMVGFEDLNDPEFRELVLERTRYFFYDEGEYFEDSFHSTIVGLGLSHTNTESGGSDETAL